MSSGLCYVKLGGGEGGTGLYWGLYAPWGAGCDLQPGGNVNAAATDWRNHRRPRRLLGRPFRHCSVPPAGHCSQVGLFLRRCPRISTRAPVTDAAAQGGCGSHSPNGKDGRGRGCIGAQVSPRFSRPPSVSLFSWH